MPTSGNRLTAIMAAIAALIVGVALYKQFTAAAPAKAGAALQQVPAPDLPAAADADGDTPAETLATVVASNEQLRRQVNEVLDQNRRLMQENRKLTGGSPANTSAGAAPTSSAAPATPAAEPAPATLSQPVGDEPSALDDAIDRATQAIDVVSRNMPEMPRSKPAAATAGNVWSSTGSPVDGAYDSAAPGAVRYSVLAPMGYALQVETPRGQGQGVPVMRFVRTMQPADLGEPNGASGPATRAAQQAAQSPQSRGRPADIPYFTLPENATLAGVTAMTSLIGRVPIDGRVTDPMQFKAVVGRENLAANGFELPPDVAGMIVTGIAIGDMALSCSEGKVRSVTFVFNDGTIRTVSSRRTGSTSVGTGGSSGDDLGFISDLHGNPCIAGKFVTNAPRYLTDVIGLGVLGVAGQAYADAQRTVRNGADGSSSSSVTGNVGNYALGQAVSGAANEVSKWMLQRLKNSFDAVITPSGAQLVIHLDKEIRLDKAPDARRLVHRRQGAQHARGERYGLQ